jgi:hypothetical protein
VVPVSATAVPEAIFERLSTDSPLGEMLSDPAAVFPKTAPEGSRYPYVVFREVHGVKEHGFHDSAARNQLWFVGAVDRSGDPGMAESIDRRCEELLDRASLALDGARLIGLFRETDAPDFEIDGGELIVPAGGIYRVWFE